MYLRKKDVKKVISVKRESTYVRKSVTTHQAAMCAMYVVQLRYRIYGTPFQLKFTYCH